MAVSNGHQFDIELAEVRRQALGALDVREEELEATVFDAVDQFLAGPPGVHGDRDGTHRRDAHEGRNPLGIVPERDTDPIPGLYPAFLQAVGALGRLVPHGLVGVALVLVDVEVLLRVGEPAHVDLAQVVGGVGEYREIDAANRREARLVGLAGRGDLGDGIRQFGFYGKPGIPDGRCRLRRGRVLRFCH